MNIIKSIHPDSLWNHPMKTNVIGIEALEPFDTFGCRNGYRSCYFIDKNDVYQFVPEAIIEEI